MNTFPFDITSHSQFIELDNIKLNHYTYSNELESIMNLVNGKRYTIASDIPNLD